MIVRGTWPHKQWVHSYRLHCVHRRASVCRLLCMPVSSQEAYTAVRNNKNQHTSTRMVRNYVTSFVLICQNFHLDSTIRLLNPAKWWHLMSFEGPWNIGRIARCFRGATLSSVTWSGWCNSTDNKQIISDKGCLRWDDLFVFLYILLNMDYVKKKISSEPEEQQQQASIVFQWVSGFSSSHCLI